MSCQCETALLEIDRAEAWDREHGGYYDEERYEGMRAHVKMCLEGILEYEAEEWME